MDTQRINIQRIAVESEIQQRAGQNEECISEYAEEIRNGANFPPIVVYDDGEKLLLADGFHRLAAYRQAGIETVEVSIYRGTEREATLHAGNKVLVVSKPHLECIRAICERFDLVKDQILFRFTIGACDDQILSYWEPNAPRYDERKQCLFYAYQAGLRTSVSVEPMLDSANIDALISDLLS